MNILYHKYFELNIIAGGFVRCRIELDRGVDYIINKYNPGRYGHVSHDFIVIKGNGFEKNQQISETKRESVYHPISIIIHSGTATLDMSTFSYSDCVNEFETNRATYPETISLDIPPGRVFIFDW